MIYLGGGDPGSNMCDSSVMGRTNALGSERQPRGWTEGEGGSWHQKSGDRVLECLEPEAWLHGLYPGSLRQLPKSSDGVGASGLCLEGSSALLEILFTLQIKQGKHWSSWPTFFTCLYCAKHQGTLRDEERCLRLSGETGRCTSAIMYSFVHSTHVGGPLFLCSFEAFIECQMLYRCWSSTEQNSSLSSFRLLSRGCITY